MGIDAIVFDVDGTLVDHDFAQRAGLQLHLAARGQHLTSDLWDRWVAAEERQFARYLAGELSFGEQRRERVREFLDAPMSDSAADEWFAAYLTHFEASWRLFDDVVATLDALAGRPVAAFSNVSGSYTRHKVETVGLTERFAVTWGVDDVGSAKPDPRTFLSLCAALGVEPARTMHVGDRYETDALGACAAGLVGVWLDRGRGLARDPDASMVDPGVMVIHSLADVLPLLAGDRRFG